MTEIEIQPGVDIRQACLRAIDLAKDTGHAVQFLFNDVMVVASPDDTAEQVQACWQREIDRRFALARTLEMSGWAQDDCVGMRPERISGDRSLMARYIMGQVIACLRSGMPPYPIVKKFVAEYCSIR